jgi:hypothetical protein
LKQVDEQSEPENAALRNYGGQNRLVAALREASWLVGGARP